MFKLNEGVTPLRKETLQDGVYQRLSQLILEGGMVPGESVTVASLSEAFGVSPMPVREALSRLQAAGALTVVSGRTVGVPKLTGERLTDLRAVRVEVEPMAARWAIARAEPRLVDDLASAVERLHRSENLADPKMYLRANYDFHFAIYGRAGSPTLISIIRNLWLQISPFFHLLRESGNFRISNRHHHAILDAVRAGDGDGASRGIANDIDDAYRVLTRII